MKTNETRTDYRATPEQWEYIERYADSINYSCILELRARIEALEAAQQPRPKPPSLKEEALKGFDTIAGIVLEVYSGTTFYEQYKYEQYKKVADTIIRALEALPE
jgi:hypothetical protein